MATLPVLNSAEGGAAGTTVTVANSGTGSGDAWDAVNIDSGAGATFDNSNVAHGALAYKLAGSGSGGASLEWDTTQTEIFGRHYFLATSFPAGVTALILCLNAGASAASVRLDASQNIALYDALGTLRATGAITLAPSTWYRIEYNIKCHATTGFVTAKLFLGDDASPLETVSATSLNTNTQMTQLLYSWRPFTSAIAWMDGLNVNLSGYPGPGANSVTASPVSVAAVIGTPEPSVNGSSPGTPNQTPELIEAIPATASGAGSSIAAVMGVAESNAIVAVVAWNSITQTCTVDDGVNTWEECGGPFAGAGTLAAFRIQMFAAFDVAAGTTTVTATFSGSNTDRMLGIHEVAGIDAFDDATYENVTSAGSAFTTGLVVAAEDGEYLLALLLAQGSVATITFPFSAEISGGGFNNNATADRVSAGAGSYSCSGTTVGTIENLATVIAAFSPKPGIVANPPGHRFQLRQAAQQASRW